MATDYISVSEALKLVSPFNGNRKEVLAFVSNVETAFSCVNPGSKDRLYQFILTKISGEPRTAISHRHLENWEELKEFLRNMYTEKRTLDFHANQLFKAKQNKSDSVSEGIQKIQMLGSKFRESALSNCNDDERAGILNLSDRLRNICFTQGLYSDRIQTIVRSRNQDNFDDIAETALEEESEIVSKQERYKGEVGTTVKCGNCGKLGHPTHACFLRKTPKAVSTNNSQTRISQARIESPNKNWEVICYYCKNKGHLARNCPRILRRNDRRESQQGKPGNGEQSSDSQFHSIGCMNADRGDFVKLTLDVSKEKELFFLVDTGADVSIVNSKKLIGTTEFEPRQKVRFKSVDRSIVETYGLVQAHLLEEKMSIPVEFQLVNQQVDIRGRWYSRKRFPTKNAIPHMLRG
jgi:hypothetical protein